MLSALNFVYHQKNFGSELNSASCSNQKCAHALTHDCPHLADSNGTLCTACATAQASGQPCVGSASARHRGDLRNDTGMEAVWEYIPKGEESSTKKELSKGHMVLHWLSNCGVVTETTYIAVAETSIGNPFTEVAASNNKPSGINCDTC